jgi:hypothetical protein
MINEILDRPETPEPTLLLQRPVDLINSDGQHLRFPIDRSHCAVGPVAVPVGSPLTSTDSEFGGGGLGALQVVIQGDDGLSAMDQRADRYAPHPIGFLPIGG